MRNKKFMRALTAVILGSTMAVSLAACGSSESASDAASASVTETSSGSEAAASSSVTDSSSSSAEEAEVPVVSGTVTTTIDMSGYDAGTDVQVWIPVGQDNEDQKVDAPEFEAEKATVAEVNTDELGNTMVYIEWDKDVAPEDRTATVSFHAERAEIKIAPEDLVEEGEFPEEVLEYLEGSSMVKVNDDVQALADEITKDETTVLGKARAIYDWIYTNMNRDNDVIGCGQGDVCELINTKAGKCTDINSVFVALCRASGIPAREMFGIRMNADDITGNQHCWAQFYLPGTGWVYADPADVLKAVLTNEWDKADQEALDTKEYYWGGVDEKRVELSSGRDLILSPAQKGEALNDFGYPYAEVDGVAVDYYTPAEFVYSIAFVAD